MSNIDTFLKMIEESDNIVFFGGAGVSTESGIPDFRSVDGLYNQNPAERQAFQLPEKEESRYCDHHNKYLHKQLHAEDCSYRHKRPIFPYDTFLRADNIHHKW